MVLPRPQYVTGHAPQLPTTTNWVVPWNAHVIALLRLEDERTFSLFFFSHTKTPHYMPQNKENLIQLQ